MALALALKYRPQLFADLVGQDAISQTLSMALDKNRIVHAYLFSGLRGSGKTSSARIFARALECERGPISTPCGECDICKATLEGRNIDIIEMDAASNRSIDNIRDLIEQTKYAPAMARFKIFIIDEVHMLTKEAFNALLKTLEEPPAYVKFILATTDPLKLPATILSRTQHFRFKKIPHRLVVGHLKMILQKEEVGYDDGALEIIARSGGGSLRDALTLTDQAINYCDKFLTTQQVTQMLGVVDPKVLRDFFGSILHNDEEGLKQNLEVLSQYECEMIIDEMLLYLKDALFSDNKDFSLLLLDRFLGILAKAKSLLNLNPDGAFVLTLLSLKMREAMKLKDINEAIKTLEKAGTLKESLNENLKHKTPNIQNVIMDSAEVLDSNTQQASEIAQNQGLQNPHQNPLNENQQNSISTNATNDNAKFNELVKKIYDRSFELGEVFSACVEFERVENGVLYWKSSPNDSQKEQLKNGFSIIKMFANEVFGKVSIKNISQDSSQKDSSQMSTMQESSTQESSQDNSTKDNPNHHNIDFNNNAALQDTQSTTTQKAESLQAQNMDSKNTASLDSTNSTQKFLDENKELIDSIKQNFGADEMRIKNN